MSEWDTAGSDIDKAWKDAGARRPWFEDSARYQVEENPNKVAGINFTEDHKRQTVLDFAGEAISGERDERYGKPEDNLGRIAKFWTVLFGVEVEPWQVALAMDLLKTSRLMHDPTHFDGWVDKAGYAAVGYEVTERRTNETNPSV